ncbi:MAG: DNA oxidative demethylase AlkB [Alphaproteobacteria bacterium]|nr:DNA oxidative demethylase AlkB [Alphaproteobacteria bacterium]
MSKVLGNKILGAATLDLFSGGEAEERLAEGAMLLRGFAVDDAPALMRSIAEIERMAAFRHMMTPGGRRMSVAMTNCGVAGWVTDRQGYRYEACDPDSGNPWPAMPDIFNDLAARAAAKAGFAGFLPDGCLINRYDSGAQLTLHQDKDERDFAMPIVSVSLGLPATFLFGGAQRRDRPRRVALESGDVVVWGGPARLFFHGVARLAEGAHEVTGSRRYNLTFRKAL